MPDATGKAGAGGVAILYDDLGTMHYPVTTASADAQRYFDQGLRLAYAFNHPQALRAFRQAQRLDPGCAMCFWGEALVLGPNLNGTMPPGNEGPARMAARRARALATAAAPSERALIEAMVRRYGDTSGTTRTQQDLAYASAMRQAAARFADDAQIPVLQAEALMLLSPWHYWDRSGRRPLQATTEAVEALERVLRAHPDHPGAIHFYIHLIEASDRAQRAAPYARRLPALMPGAAHLAHMPAHVWYRLGQWSDAIGANRDAARIDERQAAEPADRSLFLQGYYLHNLHFLMVSALMAGDAASALDAAGRLTAQVGPQARGAQAARAAPYLVHARLGTSESTLALPDPGDDEPYLQAIRLHARGIVLARDGRLDEAAAQADALDRLRARADFSSAEAAGIPARAVTGIALEVLHARIALRRGQADAAIRSLRRAVALQDRLPYMEPPYWPEPVRPVLATALAAAGRADEAERVLRDSLAHVPNDARALYGLRQVLARRGDARAAADVDRQLAAAWRGPRAALQDE